MGSTRARIAIDAMGGDFAPAEIVVGALRAREELDVEVLLVGDVPQIEAILNQHTSSHNIEIVASEGTIEMHEEPLSGLKRKPKASINVAMDLVKQKRADAVVSAGHSGAAMAAALLRLGRLPGIDRPAIGAVFPTMIAGKPVLILDVGANVDSRPKFLDQFAVMGSVYSRYVLDVENPRVGLINIGEEECKGNDLAIRAHQLLKENPRINFVGNAEGRDVLSGNYDVIAKYRQRRVAPRIKWDAGDSNPQTESEAHQAADGSRRTRRWSAVGSSGNLHYQPRIFPSTFDF